MTFSARDSNFYIRRNRDSSPTRQFTDTHSTVHSSAWAYRRSACLYKPDQFAHSSIVHSSKHWRINNYRRIGVKTFSWADVHVFVKALWRIGAKAFGRIYAFG